MNYTNRCGDCGKEVGDYEAYCFDCRVKANNLTCYDKPPFAGGLPNPPFANDLTAKALVLCAESLIRALSCMTPDCDNGRSKAIATIGEALLNDAKKAGLL